MARRWASSSSWYVVPGAGYTSAAAGCNGTSGPAIPHGESAGGGSAAAYHLVLRPARALGTHLPRVPSPELTPRNLGPWQAKIVALMGELRSFRAGEPIIRKGETGDAMYVLIDGTAEVRSRSATRAAPCERVRHAGDSEVVFRGHRPAREVRLGLIRSPSGERPCFSAATMYEDSDVCSIYRRAATTSVFRKSSPTKSNACSASRATA